MVAFLGMTACGEKNAKNAEKTPEKKETSKKEEDPKTAEKDKSESSEEHINIAKKWKITKAIFSDGKEETADLGEKTMNLKANGTFDRTISGISVAGNWKLEGKNLIITIREDAGTVAEKFTIKSSNEKELVIFNEEEKITETFEVVK